MSLYAGKTAQILTTYQRGRESDSAVHMQLKPAAARQRLHAAAEGAHGPRSRPRAVGARRPVYRQRREMSSVPSGSPASTGASTLSGSATRLRQAVCTASFSKSRAFSLRQNAAAPSSACRASRVRAGSGDSSGVTVTSEYGRKAVVEQALGVGEALVARACRLSTTAMSSMPFFSAVALRQ